MREVLFRAKTNNGKWVEGFLFHLGYDGYCSLCIGTEPLAANDYSEIYRDCYAEVVEETICQYTGLTDKNGNKIFEGDIVLAGFYKWKCKVVWDNEDARFICYTKDKDVKIVYVGMVDKDDKSALEVIGNVFENPELLTG